MKSLRTEDLAEKVCNLLCRLNLPCVIAIELGFDGFCLSFNLPCLSLALSGAHFRKLLQRGRDCFPKCPNCGEVNLGTASETRGSLGVSSLLAQVRQESSLRGTIYPG